MASSVGVAKLVIPASSLGRLELLSKHGKYGGVYRVPEMSLPGEDGPFVYKRYRGWVSVGYGTLLDVAGVRLDMDPRQRRMFDQRAIWPLRVVTDEGRAVGIIMREIPRTFFIDLRWPGAPNADWNPLELQFLLQDQAYCGSIDLPFLDLRQRLDVLVKLARAWAMLHRAGCVYGDFSATNCVVRVNPSPWVLLVDCDSVRRKGGISAFGKQPHSPNWKPPEALAAETGLRKLGKRPDPVAARRLQLQYAVQSQSTDVFKYGLAVVRLLAPTAGNSQNRDPRTVEDKLHPIARRLLRKSLGEDPKERPTMKQWFYGLQGRELPSG